ncbi:type II toxin-antitoxin system RelE/ParE family toxin [Marivirga sp.]|uniref:type II toxin-antitoxin system RelE/ParE family toxin n=1 Tax=Marivirga sp. TaxID=2018662 RepID=UPI002D7FDF70|nr:type II toxin-antitoxin system RelE/ParE family toxin [Marivirga sp.]HET8861471.1 type II toxin-antitoxin system RelE/ParE family toxin [Marivirga sp.]
MKRIRVIWTDEAIFDLELVYDFLVLKSTKAAEKLVDSILLRTRQLEDFPSSGPTETELSTDQEYRYLVESHFKIIYSIRSNSVFIETVLDTRQNPLVNKL